MAADWSFSCLITSDCASRSGGDNMATTWKPGNENSTNQKSANQKSTQQSANHTISGATLTSWSRQQKLAMIASFVILGLLLAVSACSRQSPKPALVSVASPVSSPVTGSAVPPAPQMAESPLTPPADAATAPARKTPKKRPTNVTYSDPSSGVSFLYPRKAVLTSGDDAQSESVAAGDVPMNFARSGGVTVATVALPGNWFPGTDFASAFFNVNVDRSVSEQECAHFAFVDTRNADGEPVDPEKVKIGPSEMEMTSSFSASAVKQIEKQYYHNFENGTCYEYVLGLSTEGFATEGSLEHVNRDEVFARLEKILATVKITPKKLDPGKIDAVEPEPVAEKGLSGIASGKE